MPRQESPMGLALLACDSVIEDKQSGKKSLIGLCDRICAVEYPCLHPSLTVYASLTSGNGTYNCEVLCEDGEGENRPFYTEGEICFESPIAVVDVVFRVRNIKFPRPGIYWLQFLASNTLIMTRPFSVAQIEAEEDDK